MQDPLQKRVLVLNRVWPAVNIVTAKRAFCILFQENARVIHSEDGQFVILEAEDWITWSADHPAPEGESSVHTAHAAIRVPQILLLNDFDRLPMKEVRFSRRSVFERDRFSCQYCGDQLPESELNLDHVIPRDRGGRTTWENIVTSCISCNSQKANRVPHEARMQLIKRPARPRFRPFVSYALGEDSERHPSWSNFLK